MGLFGKLFNKKKETNDKAEEKPNLEVSKTKDGNGIQLGDFATIRIGGVGVGNPTGSTAEDFYVYEWYIKDTGEVFYVGKGRGDRYKEHHERAYEAEKIRELYDTDIKFVAENLNEEDALRIEAEEMTRILNETNDCLTNRNTPFFVKRNCYQKSANTPPLKFETAPILYTCDIEEHYYGMKGRKFDDVSLSCLSSPCFVEKSLLPEELEIVYGNKYDKYYKEVISMLEGIGSKIVKTRYAKSVSAWIYIGEDYASNNDIDEEKAQERIGRRVPSYHLIDVWKCLKANSSVKDKKPNDPNITIHPIHSRVPVSKIKNLGNWDKGFEAGFKYWEQGEEKRKAGEINEAIQLFDIAREKGYVSPALYDSYAKAYRKLKDLDNEIAVLDEAIMRCQKEFSNQPQTVLKFEEQRKKAVEKYIKQQETK